MTGSEAERQLTFVQRCLHLDDSEKLEPRFQDVIFVCIDCEAYENDQTKITEIGVAVLDTGEPKVATPATNAEQLISKIRAVHYRPIEYRNLVNKKYVKGCADRFGFGVSNWISIADAQGVLRRIFISPAALHDAADFSKPIPPENRNIVIVGHGLSNDSKYLDQLHFPLPAIKNVVQKLDTQKAIPGSTKKTPIGLQRLLSALGIGPVNLHNAGNDAVYTLQALVTMAAMESKELGSVYPRIQQAKTTKTPPISDNGVRARHVYAGTTIRPAVGEGRRAAQPGASASKSKGSPLQPKSLETKRRITENSDDLAGRASKRRAQ